MSPHLQPPVHRAWPQKPDPFCTSHVLAALTCSATGPWTHIPLGARASHRDGSRHYRVLGRFNTNPATRMARTSRQQTAKRVALSRKPRYPASSAWCRHAARSILQRVWTYCTLPWPSHGALPSARVLSPLLGHGRSCATYGGQ